MKNVIIILFLIFTVTSSYSQKSNLTGQKLPNSPIESILQAPYKSLNNWETLEGKWLLLEFWTTWCAPCIKKLPEFNKLHDEMENENIQFISISPEKEVIVERFLKRKSISGWVGIDSDNSFVKALNVKTYPTTLLVNPKGIIEAYIPIEKLNGKTLLEYMTPVPQKDGNGLKITDNSKAESNKTKKLIVSKPSTDKAKKVITLSGESENGLNHKNSKPIYSIEIEKTNNEDGFTMKGKNNGTFHSTSISLLELISYSYNMSQSLIRGDKELLAQKFYVNARLPKSDPDLFEKMLQSAIEKKLKIKITKAFKKVETYELSAPNGVSKNLYTVTDKNSRRGNASSATGVIGVSNRKLDYLVKILEKTLNAEVIDHTYLKDSYDYNLYWDANNPFSILEALKKQLGLDLKKKYSESEVLTIKKENASKK